MARLGHWNGVYRRQYYRRSVPLLAGSYAQGQEEGLRESVDEGFNQFLISIEPVLSVSRYSRILKECGMEESIREGNGLIEQVARTHENSHGNIFESRMGSGSIVVMTTLHGLERIFYFELSPPP